MENNPTIHIISKKNDSNEISRNNSKKNIKYEELTDQEEGYIWYDKNICRLVDPSKNLKIKYNDNIMEVDKDRNKIWILGAGSNCNFHFPNNNSFNQLSDEECVFLFDKNFKIADISDKGVMKILGNEHVILRTNIILELYGFLAEVKGICKEFNIERYFIRIWIHYDDKILKFRIYSDDGIVDFINSSVLEEIKKIIKSKKIVIQSPPIIYFNYDIKKFILIPGEDDESTKVFLNLNKLKNKEIDGKNLFSYNIEIGDKFIIGEKKKLIEIL